MQKRCQLTSESGCLSLVLEGNAGNRGAVHGHTLAARRDGRKRLSDCAAKLTRGLCGGLVRLEDREAGSGLLWNEAAGYAPAVP